MSIPDRAFNRGGERREKHLGPILGGGSVTTGEKLPGGLTMPIVQMLFSFQGRLRRRDYWLCAIGLGVVWMILNSIVGMMMPPVHVATAGALAFNMAALSAMSTGSMIVFLLLLWPHIAIGIKRCHDRDKSGLWLLLYFLPVIGWIWLFIDLAILDGTPGPNKYGPSPKGLGGSSEPALAS